MITKEVKMTRCEQLFLRDKIHYKNICYIFQIDLNFKMTFSCHSIKYEKYFRLLY